MEIFNGAYSVIAIIAMISTAATAYLRLFVSNSLNQLKDSIIKVSEENYVSKEIFQMKLSSIDTRLKAIEASVCHKRRKTISNKASDLELD